MKYSIPKVAERGIKRPPMISFPEIAERYNVSVAQLRADFKNSKVPIPLAVIACKGSTSVISFSSRSNWYSLKDVVIWRKAFEAEKLKLINSLKGLS